MAFNNDDKQEIKVIVLEVLDEQSDAIEDCLEVEQLAEGDVVPLVRTSSGSNGYMKAPVELFGGSGTGDVNGIKVGNSGNVLRPVSGVVTIPAYETNADVTSAEKVKTALGAGSTADGTFLAKNGTWQTPPNTTYESKPAASGGSDVSLVTTGEKYTWNNKANTATTLAGYGITNAYTKAEVDNIASSFTSQKYVTVEATAQTTAATDVLPSSGQATDTVYRVAKWDGSAYNTAYYSEYTWNGSAYILMDAKNTGIDAEPTAFSTNLVQSGGVTAYVPYVAHYKDEFKTKGFLQITDGTIHVNNIYLTSDYLQVRESQSIRFVLANTGEQVAIVFYDDGKNIISVVPYEEYKESVVAVPSGAFYVRCSAYKDSAVKQYIEIVDKETEESVNSLEADVNSLEADVDGIKGNFVIKDETDIDLTKYSDPKYATGTSYVFFRKDKLSNTVNSVSVVRHTSKVIYVVLVTDTAGVGSYEVLDTVSSGTGTQDITFSTPIILEDNQYIGFAYGNVSKDLGPGNAPNSYYFNMNDGQGGEITLLGNRHLTLASVTYSVCELKAFDPKEITPYFNEAKIYSVCNDIKSSTGTSIGSRNYSSRVYIDHFYKDLTERPDIHIEGKKNYLPVYSLYELGYQTRFINNNVEDVILDVYNNTETLNIVGNNVVDETLTINHVSVRNKATENGHVRLLCIGDSVTAGSNANYNKPYSTAPETYWEWVKALFEMDKIENGNTGFDCELLGNWINLPQDKYSTSSSQWVTSEKKTFDINFNGITKNNVSACAVAKAGANAQWFLANNSGNVFWDDENSKFSLLSWLDKYRTLVVNQDGSTTRCDNSNKGSLVTDVNAYNVCEPTHVLLALGYNGRYGSEGTKRTNYLNALNTMIQTIKTEIPGVTILLHLPDTAGTYFPELFDNYLQDSNDIYSMDYTSGIAKETHDMLGYMNHDLIGLEDAANRIFYVPSYFVSPLCYGASYRSADDIGFLSSENGVLRQMVESGSNGPYLHPNNTAHACWAYQIYSLIKYTLTL